MKMKKLLAAAGALCLAVTLGACQLFTPTEGRLNDTMHTMFFDFTVTGRLSGGGVRGLSAGRGEPAAGGGHHREEHLPGKHRDVRHGLSGQWGEDEDPEAYSIPITTDPETFTELKPVGGDQLPGTYPLAVDEERSGQLVYEVPQGYVDFSLSYLELYDDGSEEENTGDTYFVFFTAQDAP